MSTPKMISASHTIVSRQDLVTVTLQVPLEQFEAFTATVDASGVNVAQLADIANTLAKKLAAPSTSATPTMKHGV